MTQAPPNPRRTSGAARAGRLSAFLLAASPLGGLVRWVARIRTSVRAKLLGGFLLIALLIIAVSAISLQIMAAMGRHSRSLDEAHERVHWSQQIEHALALQMHYTAMALVRQDEGAVAQILRENNRFNDTLARIEGAAPPDERTMLKHVVTATDIGYFVAMLCSPLTIGVHGEAIGVDGGNRSDMHY